MFKTVLAVISAVCVLTGCSAGSKLGEVITNPDGKPIVTGEICVNTPNGRFCYMPNKPTIVEPVPTPKPADVAVAPAPVPVMPVAPVPPAAPLTVAAPPLEK